MNIFKKFEDNINNIIKHLVDLGNIPANAKFNGISIEPPRDPKHGDLSTNAALIIGQQLRCNPRDLAQDFVPEINKLNGVTSVEVAGPGFLNIRFSREFWHSLLRKVLLSGPEFGRGTSGAGQNIVVEFVSANPTGPLHVGHARGAVFGDALARILSFSGFNVTREYYWNDAGAQVEKLADSVHSRYLNYLAEEPLSVGENGNSPSVEYGGSYVDDLAKKLTSAHGPRWLKEPRESWLPVFREICIKAMKDLIRDDLSLLGTTFDNETSELELIAQGKVESAIDALKSKNLIYEGVLEPPKGKKEGWEERQQLLFRATEYGDEVDRALQKLDGAWTYFASDIAYHFDKYSRGYKKMVNVWGADHGGYVDRVQAAVKALTDGVATLDVRLCQMVRLFDNGKPVKMSKRSGNFITLRQLIEAMDEKVGEGLGQGVVRFIMLTRKNDAPLDFDFAKASEQTRDNPVFYVQYAYARICSVWRKVDGDPTLDRLADGEDLARLIQPEELALMKLVADWPRQVEAAAIACEPHRIVFYLNDLASTFHSLWNKGNNDPAFRFIIEDDASLTRARLSLIEAVRNVIGSGLKTLLGVNPQHEMR